MSCVRLICVALMLMASAACSNSVLDGVTFEGDAQDPNPDPNPNGDPDQNPDPDPDKEELCVDAMCPPAPTGAVSRCEEDACIFECAEGLIDLNEDLMEAQSNGCECDSRNPEVCDGRDNDCDGKIDTDDEDYTQPFCGNQKGVCVNAPARCVDGTPQSCNDEDFENHAKNQDLAFTGLDAPELLCDRQDNNCDGNEDENCCEEEDGRFQIAQADNVASLIFADAATATTGEARIGLVFQQSNVGGESVFERGQATFAIVEPSGGTLSTIELDLTFVENGGGTTNPRIVWDGEAFSVTWVSISDDTARQLKLQRFDPEGAELGAATVIAALAPNTAQLRNVALAADPNSQTVYMAWNTDRCTNRDATRCVMLQGLDDRGELLDSFGFDAPEGDTPPDAGPPAIAFGPEGVMVVWIDNKDTETKLLWSLHNPETLVSESNGSISISTPEQSSIPELLALGGRIILAFTDRRVSNEIRIAEFMENGFEEVPAVDLADRAATDVLMANVEGRVQLVWRGDEQSLITTSLNASLVEDVPQGPNLLTGETTLALLEDRPHALTPLPGIGFMSFYSVQIGDELNPNLLFSTHNVEASRLCFKPL